MSVELFYFEGCPHYEALLPHLRGILKQEGIEIDVDLGPRREPSGCAGARFLGSPTVRVDGHDVDAGAAQRDDFGLKCRVYQTPEGLKGAPPDEWILAAVRKSQPAYGHGRERPSTG